MLPTERAPLINSAFIIAGLFVTSIVCSKNCCISASVPDTPAADMLVPDS